MAIKAQIRRNGNSGRARRLIVDAPSVASVKHAGVASSLDYMARNYRRPIKIRDFGEVTGLSRRGFFKAFRRHTGLSPAQVLRHLRIERAKRLLAGSDLTLQQLAAQCGYRSTNSFWVSFRQATGMSPKRFQRQAQRPGRVESVVAVG